MVNTRTYKREAPEDRASNRKDERDALNERAMVSLGPLGHRNNARRLDWFSVVPRGSSHSGAFGALLVLQAQRCRIDKVTSSAGSARNRNAGLFARCGIIGLRLDDVARVRA